MPSERALEVTVTVEPEATAVPRMADEQPEFEKRFTVSPLLTPATSTVGVVWFPGEVAGEESVTADGAGTVTCTRKIAESEAVAKELWLPLVTALRNPFLYSKSISDPVQLAPVKAWTMPYMGVEPVTPIGTLAKVLVIEFPAVVVRS